MTRRSARPAQAIFALLVVATFGAFFAAQRLKHTPPDLQHIRGNTLFSPNGDGYLDTLTISFHVKRADDVTVEMINHQGDAVRTLLYDHPTKAYRKIPTLTWNGRTDAGARAPDGIYRVRVTLRKEGRNVIIPRAITLDTTPPKPLVTSIGPSHAAGPELLPNKEGKVTIHLRAAGRYGRLMIFKTAPGRARLVTQYALKPGQKTTAWSGRAGGRRVSPGTYLAVVRWRDKAGNLGTSVPLDRRGLPIIGYGETLPGRGGITVRYLEIQPPVGAVPAGQIVNVGVDARGGCFRWSLRRVGIAPARHGRSCHSPFRLRVPGGASAVYLLETRTAKHTATVPVAVQAAITSPVLVVLPLMTWQGRNPVDDDGDGAPNLLDRGVGVRPDRVLAGGRLPAGFADAEGPLLAYLAKQGKRFDVTTDLDLALGRGPRLAGHSGVVLPGDVRWLPAQLGTQLRSWVRGGGKVFQIGLDSLRRNVTISAHGRLVHPTSAAPTDLFGARLRPIVRQTVTVTGDQDKLGLFSGDVMGGTGLFANFPGYEVTAALGPGERMQSDAITGDGKVVIVAARFGQGLVIRTGLLDFADHLSSDDNSAQLVLRAWTLIAKK